jgi:hypothetical protein
LLGVAATLALAACGRQPSPARDLESPATIVERAPPAYSGAAACVRAGVDHEATLARSASGAVAAPVHVQITRCKDGGSAYAFETNRQRGEGSMSLNGGPWVLLADLDFDGYADLWATGNPLEGQGRVRTSDVWRFDPGRAAFVYDTAFSALPNLDLAASAHRLIAWVENCGCAGFCHFQVVYTVEKGRPVAALRYEQECLGGSDSLVYREYRRDGDSLRLVFETMHPENPFMISLNFDLVDYTRYSP